MKVAYVIYHDIRRNDGVTRKVHSQVSTWRKLGHSVNVFSILPECGDSMLGSRQYPANGKYIQQRLLVNRLLLQDILNESPDFVYMRYDTWSATASALAGKIPLVLELNTDDISEFYLLFKTEKTIKALLRYCSYRFLRYFLLRKAAILVGVTEELINKPGYKRYNLPSIVAPNSITLTDYKIIKRPRNESSKDRPGLFFIGTPGQPWHGVDRIVELAQHMPEFDFHIVGISDENLENVHFYGYLSESEYHQILKQCQVCIGPLALERYNLMQSGPLKVREYLAYGFPVILGYYDAGLHGSVPSWSFVGDFRVISSSLAEEVKQFVYKNLDYIVKHEDVESYIDSGPIERKKLDEIRRVLA